MAVSTALVPVEVVAGGTGGTGTKVAVAVMVDCPPKASMGCQDKLAVTVAPAVLVGVDRTVTEETMWPKGKAKLVEVTRWSILRERGNTYAGRLTILGPLIGYLLIFIENILPLLEISHKLFGQKDVAPAGSVETVSWRLVVVYFGLMSIALGSIAYQIWCPIAVKGYRDWVAYVADLEPNAGALLMESIRRNLAVKFGQQNALERASNANTPASPYRTGPDPEEQRRIRCDLLTMYYQVYDHSANPARVMVAGFYVTGFVLLAIPSINVFVRVVALAWMMI